MKHLVKNINWEINKEYNINKLLYLLIDRYEYFHPNFEEMYWGSSYGSHRGYDLPSVVNENGYVAWYCKGKRHRENGKPAQMWNELMNIAYWVYDKRIE